MNYKLTQKSEAPSLGLLKKYNLLGGLLWIVYGSVGLLAIVNLVGTNALATQGVVLDTFIRQTNKTNRENQNLSVKIGKISNLSYIESTATQLGFKRVKSNLIITPVEAVAAVIQR